MRAVACFAAEMATYAAVVATGWRTHPAVGVAALLAMAAWWGTLHSPRAAIRLPRAPDTALRVAWFATGGGCLVLMLMR